MPGSAASEGAIQAAAENGLDLEGHRSSSVTEDTVQWADLILTMGAHHLMAVEALGGGGKTAMLSAFAEGREDGRGWGVPDPFAGDLEVYRDSFRVLEELVETAVAKLGYGLDTKTGNDT
jgi:protein-tyrosine-phosphatase